MQHVLLAIAVAALAVGCSQQPAGDPDSESAGVDAVSETAADIDSGLTWQPCGALECTSIDVPVDYGKLDGGHITVQLARAKAKEAGQRIGVMLYNGGGPGVPSVGAGAEKLAARLHELAPRFDVILFDPRGTGSSHPVHCVDDAVLDAARALPIGAPATDTEAWSTTAKGLAALGAGCKKKADLALLPHVGSDNVARDMDRIRAALGEDKLSFFGVSYAGVLAASYATLFPERTRAFVVDSPSISHADVFAWQTAEAKGYETVAAHYLSACGNDAGCPFHGGEGDGAADAYDKLLATLRQKPASVGGRPFGELDFTLGVCHALRSGDYFGLGIALTAAEGGSYAMLQKRADQFLGRSPSGYADVFESQVAIRLADQGCPADLDAKAVRARFIAASQSAPRFGPTLTTLAGFCHGWPVPTLGLKQVSAGKAPPLLLVAGTHDPPVPYSNATSLRDDLGNGTHVLKWDGKGHVAYRRSKCVRDAIAAFLAAPSTSPSVTSCN